jgi:hypothetical protein
MSEELRVKNEELRMPAKPASILIFLNRRERSDLPELFIIHHSFFILSEGEK